MTERAGPFSESICAAIISTFVRAAIIAVFFVFASILALSGADAPRPGCGSQRLLHCRLHPAGRCPNSSSLFPPLAAVVAIAPRGRAIGKPVRPTRDEQSLILS